MIRLKKFWRSLGPGLVTGASDDDPSGIAIYTIAGAKYGNASLWAMLYSLPFMIVMQEMSARIGISSSCGLAGNIKRYYPKYLLFTIATLILITNIFNIGADIAGMAAAIKLLVPKDNGLTELIIVLGILLTFITLPYRKIVMIFKWLSLSLLAYLVAGFISIDNWGNTLYRAFMPTFIFSKDYLVLMFAVIGTTVSPYLAVWQASEEAEEKKLKNHSQPMVCEFRTVTRNELIHVNNDTRIGMIFSNLIGFFIIALTSSVLFNAGLNNIETIAEAAKALEPLAGEYAYLLFTIGIVSSGLLAIPILAGSAAYVISEVFGWQASLEKPFSKARKFYLVIIISTLLGLLMTYMDISPIKALYYTAILHGITAPVLIGILLHMANNPAIIGPNKNSNLSNIIGYATMLIMTAGSIIFFMTL